MTLFFIPRVSVSLTFLKNYFYFFLKSKKNNFLLSYYTYISLSVLNFNLNLLWVENLIFLETWGSGNVKNNIKFGTDRSKKNICSTIKAYERFILYSKNNNFLANRQLWFFYNNLFVSILRICIFVSLSLYFHCWSFEALLKLFIFS